MLWWWWQFSETEVAQPGQASWGTCASVHVSTETSYCMFLLRYSAMKLAIGFLVLWDILSTNYHHVKSEKSPKSAVWCRHKVHLQDFLSIAPQTHHSKIQMIIFQSGHRPDDDRPSVCVFALDGSAIRFMVLMLSWYLLSKKEKIAWKNMCPLGI